jgi:hypothetical protein
VIPVGRGEEEAGPMTEALGWRETAAMTVMSEITRSGKMGRVPQAFHTISDE